MDFEFSGALGAAIAEDLAGPPAFEITAAPDADLFNVRQIQGAVHPTAATPFGRANVPVRMIIERDEHDWFVSPPNPERGKMVKISRAVQNKSAKLRCDFLEEGFDKTWWRGKTKMRPPLARIQVGQA